MADSEKRTELLRKQAEREQAERAGAPAPAAEAAPTPPLTEPPAGGVSEKRAGLLRRRAEREAAKAPPEGSTAAKNLNPPAPTPPQDTRRASGRAGTGFASATVAGLDDALVDERITRAHRLQEQHPDLSTDDSYALADEEMEAARVSPAKAQSGSGELAEAVSSGDPQRALEARLAYGRLVPVVRLTESGDAGSAARYRADVARLDKMSLLELGNAVLTGPEAAEPIEAQGAMKTHAVRDLRDAMWLSFGATAYLPAALAQEIGEIFNYDAGLQGFSEMGWAYSELGEAVGNYATDRDVQQAVSGGSLAKTVVRMGVKSGLTDAYAWATNDADLAQFSRDATVLPEFDAPAKSLYDASTPDEKRAAAERMGSLAYGMLPADLQRKDAELLALVRQDAREGRLTGTEILNDLANGVADSVLLGTISRTSLDELGAGIAPSIRDINKTYARRAAVMQATGGPEADRLGELVLGGLYDVDREADSKIWLKPSKMQHILAVVGVAPEVFYEADIPLLPEFIADAAGTEGWLAKLAHLRIPTKAGLEAMAQTGAYDDMLTSWGMKKGSEWATFRDPDSSYRSRIAANILNPEFQGLGLQGVYRRGGGQIGSGVDKGLGTGDVLADFLFNAEGAVAAPVRATAKTGVNIAKAARFAPKGVKLAAARSQLPSRLRPANLRGLDADAALVKTVVDGIESGAARGQLPNEHQLKITENVDEMLRSTGASPEAVRESMVKYAQESGAQSLDDIGKMVNRAGTPEVQALRKTPDYLRVQREIEAVAAADNDLPASRVPAIMAMEEWAAHVAVATGNAPSLDDYFKGTHYAAGGTPGEGAYFSADGTPSPRGVEEAGIVDRGDATFVREPDAPTYEPRTFDEMVTDGDVEEVLTHLRRQNPELGEVRAEQVRKRVQDSLGNIRRLDIDAKDALDRAAASSGDVGRAQFDVAAAKRQSARNAREALRVELDNEARKAKATPPVRSQRTGTDAVDARLGAAKRFEGVSPSDVRDADRLLEMLGHPLEGGRFKVAKQLNADGTAVGSYKFAQDIVSLAQRAFDEGMSTRTLAHEIGHRVSSWLPKEKAADLLRQYIKERKVAMRKNPEWFDANGRLTAKNIDAADRWRSVDEWFAERFADYASKRLTQLDAAGRSVMDAAMFMLEKIKARIVEFFGIDAVPGIVEDLMAGKLDRVVADAQAPLRTRLMMTGVTDVSGHGMRPQSDELFMRVDTATPTLQGILVDPNNPQHLVSYEAGKSTPDVHARNTFQMYEAGDIPLPKSEIVLTSNEKIVLDLLEGGTKINELPKKTGLSASELKTLTAPDSPVMRVVEEKSEHAIKHLSDNILFAVRRLPPEVVESVKGWYEGARSLAQTWARRYGHATKTTAAVIAALSPKADWFKNVSAAERMLDIHQNQMKHVWDAAMESVVLNPTFQLALPSIKGKALKDVVGDMERAAWIAAYDGAHNSKTYRVVNPDGSFGDVVMTNAGVPAKFTWGVPEGMAKAVAILDNPTQEMIYKSLGWAHKVRSFYNNIFDPNHIAGDVTIDTHAVAAARWRPLAADSVEANQNFGGASSGVTGQKGAYYLYAEAYRRAAARSAKELGMDLQPRQIQSIAWESARGQLYKKTAAAQSDALNAWKAHVRGEITADAARLAIVEQQGKRAIAPSLLPGHSVYDATGTSSYAEKLPVNRTPESELRSRTLDRRGVRDDSPGVLAVSDPTAGRYDPQTPGFRTFIEGSAAVNADKTPKLLVIGTTHEFDALDPELANVQNHHGRAIYMSSSTEDVNTNYATRTGPDITSRIENLHESLVDTLDDPNAASAMVEAWVKGNPDRAGEARNLLVALDDPFADVAADAMDYSSKTPSSLLLRDIARWNAEQQIAGTHGGAILLVYAAIKNPVDLRPGQVTRFDIDTQWSPDGEDILGESGLGVDVLEAIRRMTGSDPGLADRIISRLDTTDGFTAAQLEVAVRDVGDAFIDDFNGEPSSPGQFLQDIYREVGFDGIVLNADEAFGSGSRHRSPMAGVSPDTEHWVAFKSTQVKSATGNTGAYDTSDPRLIRSPVGPSKSLVIDPPPPVAPDVLPERAPGDAQWGDARGPVGWWMPLDEAEEALGGMAYEHAVVYDGQGRQLARWGPEDTEKASPGLDLTSRCVVYPSVLDELAKAGDGLYTHNHPSGAPPSIDDLLVAHRGNVAEIRAVANGDGFTWVVKRPAGGWPSLSNMRDALREISDAAYPTARDAVNRLILDAGGNPADGPAAAGYSESAWRKTYADALPAQWEQSARARRLGLVLERVPHRGQLGLDSSVLPGAAGAAPGARPPAAGGPPGPVGVVRSPDAPFNPRLGLTHKEASARVPEVAEAARRLFRGEITKTEFAAVVDRFKPVTPYAEVPTPATNEAMTSAVSAEKRGAVNAASALPAGSPVGLRLDIPAYTNHGTWVVTVHEGKASGAGGAAGKMVGYQSTATLRDAQFGVAQKGAFATAMGKAKDTFATIGGKWVPSTPEEALARAQAALNDPEWVQVGMDPERHGYFYNRATMQPVVSAEEAIQIGPLVLAKKPVYGDPASFLYSRTNGTIHGSIEPIRGERVPGKVRNPARDAWIAEGKAQAAKVAALEEAEVQAWWATVDPADGTPAPKTIAEAKAWGAANGTDPALFPEPSPDLLRETGALEARRKTGPPKMLESQAAYAGHLIRLFKTGDFDTWLHEFSHRIRFEMGDAWTDDLVKFFDNEPDPARPDKMRLTTKGEEQLAEAARIHLRGKLHPNGRLRGYVDDVVGYLREMWLRLRGKPLDVPEGFRVWWDMVLDPAKAVKRPMVDLQADRLSPTELPTVVGRDDIDILREKNPVAAVGKKREEFRVALDPRRARQALGVKVGDTEADALSLYARAYGEVVLGQFRRVWGGEDLVRMGTSVVPRSRAKKIEKTVRGKLDVLLGGEWKPNTDGSFTLTPQQQAAAKTLIDEVAAEPLGEALPVALTERNADLSTISMEDWNALNTALVDVHAGPGAWRDLRAENAAVGGLRALINVLDERYFTTGTILGDTKAQMKRWFVVEDAAGPYMQNVVEREALAQMSRRLGGVDAEIRKKVAAIKRKDPDADISQFYREIAGTIEPTIDPARAVAVGKMHGSVGNADTTSAVFDAMDVADKEFGGLAAVLGSSRRGVSPTEASALATLEAARTAVRAGTLSPADLAADAAYIDALSITQSALKRRFQAMQQVADEVILAFSGGDKSVLTGYGAARGGDDARVVRLYTDWFDSPGEWPRIWTELVEQGRQAVEKAGGSYNPNAAVLAALIRLRSRAILSEYFDGLLTRLPAMDPELVGKRGVAFEQAARMGDRGDGMEGHANRVQHYLNALTTWKTTNLALVDAAGTQTDFHMALGLDVEGLADFDAYADAQRVLAGIGWKYGEGAGWTRYVVGDREVLLPDLLVTEIDGVIERTSKLGAAWSTDWARGGKPGTGAGNLDSLLRPIAETVQWTLGMARIGLTTGLIIPNPAYFIGNAFGGMLQAYEGMGLRGVLDLGRSAVFLPGERASMTRGVMARIWNDGIGLNYYRPNTPPIITPSGAVWTADAIADAYTRFGLNTSFAKAESPRDLLKDIERQQGRWIQRWKKDKWMPARYWQNTLMEVATSIDNFYRTASFIDGLKRGMSPEQAAETARLIGFDYGALTDFEKNVARNTVMFYSYMRRNVDLTLWTMINHPGRIATQLRGARGLQQYWLNNDSEAYVPEYMDGRFLLYYHEAIAATQDVPGTANAKRGTAIFSPPVPAADFLGLFVDGLNAIDGDPNATRELGARLSPWAQALIVATTQKELFSGRDVQQYNTVPGWVVETSRLWDGGIFADNFLQVEPIGQMDPSLEVNPGADRYQARNGVGWWMFRNLTPAGRPMDTLSQMARADFGESVFGEGGGVQAGVDMLKVYREAGGSLDIVAEPLSRAILPDEGPNLWEPVDTSPDLDTARPGLTEWEELMALYGFKPIQLDTAEMVADRAAKDLSSAARQRTSVLKRADPFR